MPAITKKEKITFQELFEKSYTYLNDNFHKFDQKNKIQVAIAVCKMAVPQKLEHSGGVTFSMPMIQKSSGEVLINLEFQIGTPHITEDTGHTPEASRLN